MADLVFDGEDFRNVSTETVRSLTYNGGGGAFFVVFIAIIVATVYTLRGRGS